MYSQLVYPNLNQTTAPGWCLKFVQDSFRAPVMHASATIAANATSIRNASRTMPNVAVPVWFDHWGTYQGRYANWGHVVVWTPGKGFLSSPASGFGQLWLSSIEAVERTFNAKYRFWSLDINTLLVAEPVEDITPTPGQEEDEDMAQTHSMESPIDGTVVQAVYDTDGFYTEWIGGNASYNANIRKMFGVTTLHCSVTKSHFNAIKASVLAKSESSVTVITADVPILPEKE